MEMHHSGLARHGGLRRADDGRRHPDRTLGNSLKCFASEMCYDVVNMGLQVFAGYGYSREYPLEKLLRDARIYSIFEGTNQVQRQVIGKTLLRLRAVPREHSRLYQAGPGHDRDPHGSENQHPHPRRCAEHRQPL